MASVQTYVEVDLSEFDDAAIIRGAYSIIERRASAGPLDTDTEHHIERLARLMGVEPGTLPPRSTAHRMVVP